jgi:putative toxin-antitoxin system antitoxin component (TIGR02293 family)
MPSNLPPDDGCPTETTLRDCAAIVFGCDAEGRRWFEKPAMSLNQSRPADLMGTPAGRELVRTVLGRMDRGVYT